MGNANQFDGINSSSMLEEEIRMILEQHEKDEIMIKKLEKSEIFVQHHDNDKNMSSSLRRRKNGAFSRPHIIDVVGQPKHKNSVLNDCLLDECFEQKLDYNDFDDDVPKQEKVIIKNSLDESDFDNELKFENMEEGSMDYTEKLGILINNLIINDADAEFERKTIDSRCKNKEITNYSTKIKFQEPVNTHKETKKDIIDKDDDYFDISSCQYSKRHGNSLTEKASPRYSGDVKRSCSLPVTKESKSRLPMFLTSLKNNKNISNINQSSSDGEGSAQSMMSFDSNGSSHGKRSRSGSILSRLSRSSSSPMSDKRSRSGSITRNRTGCPQYFIPGENRGRLYMPTIDLFETSSLCIKGITFRIRRKMPRTHRAVSMIGCMGFIVPAPSTYFEK